MSGSLPEGTGSRPEGAGGRPDGGGSLPEGLVTLDVRPGFWERTYRVAPLVVVGTVEEAGYDLAPKHMALPLGWEGYYGFVCSPRHATYHNIRRTGEFSVSYPRPGQVVLAALAAAPRSGWENEKSIIGDLPVFPATRIDAPFLVDAYLYLECELDRIVDGFGPNSLIAGRVVAAHASRDALVTSEGEPDRHLAESPLLAYVDPGRFAEISVTRAFPFPEGYRR